MQRRVVCAAVLLLISTVQPALAAMPPSPPPPPVPAVSGGVSVVPSATSPYVSETEQFLDLGDVRPGTLLADTVVVRNTTASRADVLLYAVDASPALGGGFGYGERGQTPTGIGAWLDLAQERIALDAGSGSALAFELKVPAGAAPGTYVGGIVAEVAGQVQSGPFGSTTRFAMPVRLVVPGGAPGLTPGRGRPDGRFFVEDVAVRTDGERVCPVVRYRNETQDVLDPVVDVEVDGLLRGTDGYRRSGLGAVGPGETTQVSLPCATRPLGPAEIRVRVTTPRGQSAEAVTSTWLPLPLLLGLLLLLLLVGALSTTYLRGVRRTRRMSEAERAAD